LHQYDDQEDYSRYFRRSRRLGNIATQDGDDQGYIHTNDDDLDDAHLYPFDEFKASHKAMVAFLAWGVLNDEPSVKLALASEMRDDWIAAIKIEVNNLLETGAIVRADYGDRSPTDQTIFFTMRLKVKRYADGHRDKLKARGCAMGNLLSKMPDFEKYSPTVSSIVAAAVLAIATFFRMKTCTVDTVSAYLMQAYKENPALFIKFPRNVALAADLDPDVLYRIRKYLYGLPDSGRAYYLAYSAHLIDGGYTRSHYDPCLFFKFVGPNIIIVSIHVDDTFLAASNQRLIEEFKNHLKTKFTITFNDKVHTYLGVQHTLQLDGSLKLNQLKLMTELFDKLDISTETSQSTPSVEHPPKVKDPEQLCDPTEYKSIVGIMLFLLKSRPDMAYVVSDAATRSSKATNKDRGALQVAGQYLYNTRKLGLTLPAGAEPYSRILKLTCWVDASYLTHSNSKSHTGYCFSLGSIGMFYSKSSVQQLIATSSTHAEMRALFTAVKDIIFLMGLFTELGYQVQLPIEIHEDNAACVILSSQDFGPSKNVKHFIMLVSYVREQVHLGYVKICDIDTDKNISDILTKDLFNFPTFDKHRAALLGALQDRR
jgi:hypothetical protein